MLFLGARRRVISSKGMNVLFIICSVCAQAGRVEPLLEACVVKIYPGGTSVVFIRASGTKRAPALFTRTRGLG